MEAGEAGSIAAESGRVWDCSDNTVSIWRMIVCYGDWVGWLIERFWDAASRVSRDVAPGDPPSGIFGAFVPHPVAGWSPLLDAKTWQAARRAEDVAAEVCTDLAPGDAGARWMAVRLESSASSRIEGIGARDSDVACAEARPDRIEGADWSVRAVIGNITATEHAMQLGDSVAPVTVEDICSMHRALMGDDPIAGRLRTGQNWIGAWYSTPLSAAFVPPPPELVPGLLDDLVASINEPGLPPVVHAAVVHAQFEAIHPFDDGNGRTGRALIVLMLARSGLTKSLVLPISVTLAQRRDSHVRTLNYLEDLNGAHSVCGADGIARSEALNNWITLLASAVDNAAIYLSAITHEVADIQQNWRNLLRSQGTSGSNTAMDLIEILPRHPVLSVNAAADLLDANNRTARRAIQRLSDIGILVQANDGRRNRLYEATDITNTLAEFTFINPGSGRSRRQHRTSAPAH